MNNFIVEYLDTKSGEKTVKVDGYFLYSKYKPKQEAIMLAEKYFVPEKVQIIIGYGLGYLVDEILNLSKNKERIIVIDPIFRDIKNNGEFEFINNVPDDVEKIYELFSQMIKLNENINLISSPNYDKIIPLEYKNILKALNKKLQMDQVFVNTYSYFQDKWHTNYIKNIEHAITDTSFVKLHNSYNIPVIIASGGPSLSKQLNIIKKIRNKIILIAAGSTINSLLASDVLPDYVVSIDGSYDNYGHFKDRNNLTSKLIYSMSNFPDIRHSFKEAYYFVDKGEKVLQNHLQNVLNTEIDIVVGGASVANYAFSIALKMTSGPIAFIGQDLAYTDNKTHADNNTYQNIVNEEFINKNNLIESEGYYGDSVLTDYPFLIMKRAFEQIKQLYAPNREIYNCTEGGINISGFTNIPLNEFVNKFAISPLSNIEQDESDIGNINIRIEKSIKFLNYEIETYKKLIKLLEENINYLKLNRQITKFEKHILEGLEKNDKRINRLIEKTSLSIAFSFLNLQVLKYYQEKKNESREEAYIRTYKQSELLYQGMLEIIEKATINLDELIVKLKNKGD